jgi:hypothetical protein
MPTYESLPARDVPPTRPIVHENNVMRQPGTMAAVLLAATVIVGFAFLYVGTTYAPSRIVQIDPVVMTAPDAVQH